MKRLIRILLFGLLIIAVNACGASEKKEDSAQRESEAWIEHDEYIEKEIVYTEEEGQGGIVRTAETVTVGTVTFYFEEVIETSIRESCISATIEILSRLKITEPFTIYVFTKEATPNTEIRERTIYTYVQEWKTAEYITSIIQAVYGEYSLYGMAYGYAYQKRNEFDGYSFPEKKEVIYKTEAAGYYDINGLCFNERFNSEEEIEDAKQIAIEFAESIIQAQGEEGLLNLLKESNRLENLEKINGLLTSYYTGKGIQFEPLHAMVKMGGCSLDYIIKTKKGTFYMPLKWKDRDQKNCSLITEGFLHKDYDEVKWYFELNLTQLAAYDTKLSAGIDLSETIVRFVDDGNSNTGITHTIFLGESFALLHEYVHQITILRKGGPPDTFWAGEGLAEYYMVAVPNLFYITRVNEIIRSESFINGSRQDEVFLTQQFEDYLGRPAEMETDLLDYLEMFAYFYERDMKIVSYQAGASYCRYLIETYGEDRFLELVFDTVKDYSVLGDKTEEEVYADWVTYLNNKFKGYITITEWKRQNEKRPWK